MNTWNRFIQPLINHYKNFNLEKYNYNYQPWDGDPLEWLITEKAFTHPITNDDIGLSSDVYASVCFLKRVINESYDIPNVEGGEEAGVVGMEQDDFFEYMTDEFTDLYNRKCLPCLLGYIYLKAERQRDEMHAITPKPNLLYLLDLTLKQAEQEFLHHYYDYNVKKHSDIKELEQSVGMRKKSLAQKYKRNSKL